MEKIRNRGFNSIYIKLLLAVLIISSMTAFAQNIPNPGKPVCAGCGRTLDQINTIGHAKTCPYYVAPKTTSGSTNSSQSKSTTITNAVTNGIIEGLISNILSSDPDQEKADLEAKQKEQERIKAEEQHKKMSLEEWRKFQNEEEMKRQMERDRKVKQGEDLLPHLKTIGNEGDLRPFSIENSNQEANVVDLKGKSGATQLFTTEDEQKKRDDWMQENGFNNLAQIKSDNVIDGNGDQPAERTWTEASLRTALGKISGTEGFIASWEINLSDETFTGLNKVTKYLVTGNDVQALEVANKLPGQAVLDATGKTVAEGVIDAASEKVANFGGELVTKSYQKKTVQNLVDKEKWGIGYLKDIVKTSDMGREYTKHLYEFSKTSIEFLENKYK
jgi:hypothetical protein